MQGGIVVNADQQFKADVLTKDGLILQVEPELEVRLGGYCSRAVADQGIPRGMEWLKTGLPGILEGLRGLLTCHTHWSPLLCAG